MTSLLLEAVDGSHALLKSELIAASLPVDDLEDNGRSFFALRDNLGAVIGYSGLEAYPVWLGHPMTAHWGVEDPAAVTGTDIEIQRAFAETVRFLKNRSGAFLSLPLSSIEKIALEQKLRQIGQMERSTSNQEKSA